MGYQNSRAPRRAKNDFVIGVGWHAYVNWSPPLDQPGRPVPMTDSSGMAIGNDLDDGQEVEILAWRPRSRDGLSYQIRRLSDGSEWWVASTFLRRVAAPSLPPPAMDRPHEAAGQEDQR